MSDILININLGTSCLPTSVSFVVGGPRVIIYLILKLVFEKKKEFLLLSRRILNSVQTLLPSQNRIFCFFLFFFFVEKFKKKLNKTNGATTRLKVSVSVIINIGFLVFQVFVRIGFGLISKCIKKRSGNEGKGMGRRRGVGN